MGTKGSAPGPRAGADAIDQERRAPAELIRRIHRYAHVAPRRGPTPVWLRGRGGGGLSVPRAALHGQGR